MPRQESPKEDLMRDATAFVERVEFSQKSGDSVVVGFRSAASAESDASPGDVSFFFGEEPVYQFNAACELRRGFVDGIVKAEKGSLVRMSKARTNGNVEMRRHEFTAVEVDDFLMAMQSRLRTLLDEIGNGDVKVLRSIPEGDAVAKRVESWLAQVATQSQLKIASRPNA